ncbi:MAG: hypothetical protein HQ530_04820 [Parcubacteria group bacterium]|nr:hypothetical protein [Parcubacteria group bacterium]
MNKKTFEERLVQLIFLARTYYEYSHSYNQLIAKIKKMPDSVRASNFSIHGFLVITSHSFLFQSILCLHPLLKQTKRNDELSFQKYFNKFGKLQKEVANIRKIYKKSELGALRDKIISHKQLKNVNDPETFAILSLKDTYFRQTENIIKKLEKLATDFFDAPCNNYMYNFSKDSLEEICTHIDNKIIK